MLVHHRTPLWHICCLIGLSVLIGVCLSALKAQVVPQSAPLNPAFDADQQRQQTCAKRTFDGHPLGYIPSRIRLPVPHSPLMGSFTALPAQYDLRTTGKLTPIKNQEESGCCWAFASYGSLESCLLPGASWDFSENNMKNNSGYDYDPNFGGGNYEMATAYLARWGYQTSTAFPCGAGPVLNSQDPYNDTSTYSPNFSPSLHVQQVAFLPTRANAIDNTAIKEAVMQYGAVGISLDYEDEDYNSDTFAYYNNSIGTANNHAVDIVG